MDAIIARCEARFERRVQLLNHPILGPWTAAQWRKLHLVHGWHHQKQLSGLGEGATRQKAERGRSFLHPIVPLLHLFSAIFIINRSWLPEPGLAGFFLHVFGFLL